MIKSQLENHKFYDTASSFYDSMIEAEKAVTKKQKIFSKLFTRKKIYFADLGCGSGVDSIALSLNYIKVDAFDPSQGMLEEASKNFKRFNLKVDTHNYAIDTIPEQFFSKYDTAVSLGNTLANIHPEKLEASLSNIFSMLKAGGECYIQILNYDLIKHNRERIISIKEADNNFFVRFYDFYPDSLKFNLLRFNKNEPDNKFLISTDIYPYTKSQLEEASKKTGFSKIDFFANLELNEFKIEKSKNLVLRLTKPSA